MMKFDKDITKIKRVTFFLRHSVVVLLYYIFICYHFNYNFRLF